MSIFTNSGSFSYASSRAFSHFRAAIDGYYGDPLFEDARYKSWLLKTPSRCGSEPESKFGGVNKGERSFSTYC